MRRLRAVAALLGVVALLAGCTGTTANIPPLLLAIGRTDPTTSSPEMVLVEDNFPNQPRFTIVANSEQPLPYPAVASDVVDRAGTRQTMVVLTRDTTGANSALVSFNLANIDPAAPTAFQQTSSLQLTGGTSPLFSGGQGPWCFSGLSVSYTGQYVYLIDDPNACAATPTVGAPVRLYEVDTTQGTEQQILPASNMQATVPYDDQSDTTESVYFLVGGIGYAQLYQAPVPYVATEATQVATFPGTGQLALRYNGASLVAITNSQPYGPPVDVPSTLEAIALPASGIASSITTVDGARALGVEPSGISPQAVVAGFASGYGQTFVHASPTDTNPAQTAPVYNLTGVAVAIDPANNFAYVLNNGQIVLIDLLNASPSSQTWYTTSTSSLSASDLQLPTDAGGRYVTALAWTRAAQ